MADNGDKKLTKLEQLEKAQAEAEEKAKKARKELAKYKRQEKRKAEQEAREKEQAEALKFYREYGKLDMAMILAMLAQARKETITIGPADSRRSMQVYDWLHELAKSDMGGA